MQLLFASLAIAGRIVLREFPPAALVLVRICGAAVGLAAINAGVRRGRTGARWIHDRRDLLRLALLGLLGITANQTLYLFGLRHTTAINATILVTTTPVFTVLASILLRREPPSALKLAGIALAALGTVYLIGPDRLRVDPATALGNALIVLGMACYAAYFLLAKPLLARHDPLTVTTYVLLFGALGVLPLGVPAAVADGLGAVSATSWALTVYIIVGPTIVAYLLNIVALRRASSNLVAVYIYLQPICTMLVAPLVLSGERVTARALLASVAIFVGVGLVIRAERRQSNGGRGPGRSEGIHCGAVPN